MDRTYLFVPPEENAEVKLLGAHWDGISKRWYIGPDEVPGKFSKWLAVEEDGEFNIVSSDAYVATASAPCQRCRASMEVICIHCGSGTVSGETLTQFTVSNVWAMDEALARQLLSWPNFRRVGSAAGESGGFANHCPLCGEPQEDMFLHDEPDTPFFDIPRARPGSVRVTSLVGTIQLSGDEHFAVE